MAQWSLATSMLPCKGGGASVWQPEQQHAALSQGLQQFKAHRQSKAAAASGSGLWDVLVSAGGQQLREGFEAFTAAAQEASARIQRGSQPRPPGFPPGPPGDSAPAMLQDPLRFLQETTQSFPGGMVGLVLGGEYVVLVTDPDAAKDVLIDSASTFVKEGTAFFPGSSLAGNGLLVSDGQVWRRQRQLSNPAFRFAAVQAYAKGMATETQRMIGSAWRHGGRRNVYSDYNDLTLRITVGALFGSTVRSEQARQVAGSIETAFGFFADRAATGFITPEWVPIPQNLAYQAAVDQLDTVVYQLIADRRSELQRSDREPQDLLDNLLLSRDEAGGGMTDRALRDELMTLLVAGQETSAILLAWTSAMLAHHPRAQAAAAAEVRQVLGDRIPTADDARHLPYLESVILETLRLRPPAYMVGRCAAQPVPLAGFQLALGTTILVSPFILHRDAAAWPDAETFLPERWPEGLQPPAGQSLARAALAGMGHKGRFVPFGAGPRNCIGTGFAMLETTVIMAAILQSFELHPPPGAAFPPANPRITLRPAEFDLLLSPRL